VHYWTLCNFLQGVQPLNQSEMDNPRPQSFALQDVNYYHEGMMLTISEIAVTIAIWTLTAIGCFFGIRAAIRSRRSKGANMKHPAENPAHKDDCHTTAQQGEK
jgi:hypothetical protein